MSCAASRGNFPELKRPRTPLGLWLDSHPDEPRYWPRMDLRRLTPEQVARIRAELDRGVRPFAREFGVSDIAVWKVRRRITYRDLP
jgi:hypothetical protein